MKKFYLAAFLAAATALVGCGEKSNENAAVKARQDLMQDWRAANEAMKKMIEQPDSFDAATFKERASFIATSNDEMWQHFNGEATKGGKSTDAVWSNAEGFTAAAETFAQAAKDLADKAATATTADEVNAAFGAMAENCGSCHKEFKMK